MAELVDIKEAARTFMEVAARQAANGDLTEAEATVRSVLRFAPRHAPSWRLLGDILSASPGKRAEAAQAYTRALELDPYDEEAEGGRQRLGARETAAPASRHAERELTLPHMAPPDGKESAIAHARACETAEKWGEAKAAWQRVLEIDPSDTWAWSQLGHLLSVNMQDFEGAEKAFRAALDEDPTDDWAWGKLGIMLADFLGRVDEGQAMLRHAISLEPGEAYYFGWLGWSLYRQSEDFEGAEKALEEAVRLWPEYQWAHFHLGFVRYALEDRPRKAEKAFLRALELEPGDVPTLYNLGCLYEEQLMRPRKALKYFAEVIKYDVSDPAPYKRIGVLYHQYLNDPAEAATAYQKALDLDPEDYDVRVRYGWVLWEKLHLMPQAFEQLVLAASMAPANAWVLTHVAQAYYLGANDFAKGKDYLEQALIADPNYDWARALYGSLLLEEGQDLSAAEFHLREAIRINPDYSFPWARLGRLLLVAEGDMQNAWNALVRAVELAPTNIDALSDLLWLGIYRLFRPDLVAEYALRVGDHPDATAYSLSLAALVLRSMGENSGPIIDLLRRAMELSPDDHFVWHTYGEVLLYDLGDLESAEEALLRAQTLDHECSTLDCEIALVRYAQGRYDGARGHIERALEIDSEVSLAWRAYGCYLNYSGGDEVLAEEALERAVELEQENFEPWAVYAAFLRQKEGREDDAAVAYEKALELAPKGLDLDAWAQAYLTPLVLR